MSKEDGPSPTPVPVLEVHTPNDEKLIVNEDGSIIENNKIQFFGPAKTIF